VTVAPCAFGSERSQSKFIPTDSSANGTSG
jgi:hypothetical protein